MDKYMKRKEISNFTIIDEGRVGNYRFIYSDISDNKSNQFEELYQQPLMTLWLLRWNVGGK
jgi:hypothetical protein